MVEQFVIVKCVAEQDADLFEEEIFLLDLTRCVLLIDGYNVIASRGSSRTCK